MPRRVTSSKRIPQKLAFMESHLSTWGQRWSSQKRPRRLATENNTAKPRSEATGPSYDVFPSHPEPTAEQWSSLSRSEGVATSVSSQGTLSANSSPIIVSAPHGTTGSPYHLASSFQTQEGVLDLWSFDTQDGALFKGLSPRVPWKDTHDAIGIPFPSSPADGLSPYSCDSTSFAQTAFDPYGLGFPFENSLQSHVASDSHPWNAWPDFLLNQCLEVDHSLSDLATTPSPISSAADLDQSSPWSPSHSLPHNGSTTQPVLDTSFLTPHIQPQSPYRHATDFEASHMGIFDIQDQLPMPAATFFTDQPAETGPIRSKHEQRNSRRNDGRIGLSRPYEYPGASQSALEF